MLGKQGDPLIGLCDVLSQGIRFRIEELDAHQGCRLEDETYRATEIATFYFLYGRPGETGPLRELGFSPTTLFAPELDPPAQQFRGLVRHF